MMLKKVSSFLMTLGFLTLGVVSCSYFVLPPMAEQKAKLQRNEIKFRELSSRVFIEVWGPPTYQHVETTAFYRLDDGNAIPSFRLKPGEAPKGWDNSGMADVGEFLGYAERGELLGFVDDRLVYRERVTAEQVHAVGKQWQYEDRFRTGLEKSLQPPR
jgi:hypothetical protein